MMNSAAMDRVLQELEDVSTSSEESDFESDNDDNDNDNDSVDDANVEDSETSSISDFDMDDRDEGNISVGLVNSSQSDVSNAGDNMDNDDDEDETTEFGSESEDNLHQPKKVQESRYSKIRRVTVLTCLLSSIIIVPWAAHYYLTSEKRREFAKAYKLVATTIESTTTSNMQGLYEKFTSISEMLTAHAASNKLEWPFVTMPHFDAYTKFGSLSFNQQVMFTPFVERPDFTKWEDYSTKSPPTTLPNSGTITPFIYYHRRNSNNNNLDSNNQQPQQDNDQVVKVPESGASDLPVAPLWQLAPQSLKASQVNFNLLSIPSMKLKYDTIMDSKSFIISPVMDSTDLLQSIFSQSNITTTVSSDSCDSTIDQSASPSSLSAYPVFSTLDKQSIVGMIIGQLSWTAFFSTALSPSVNGVHAVLRNTCSQAQTFVLRGNEVRSLGYGDLHEKRYNKHEYKIDLSVDANVDKVTSHSSCHYSLSVYPTYEYEVAYRTAGASLLVFFLTLATLAAVFLIIRCTRIVKLDYDTCKKMLLQAKQQVILRLPEVMRKRLNLQVQEPNKAEDENKQDELLDFPMGDRTSLKAFLDNEQGRGGCTTNTKPIADLFPETTVLFGDIVGFTAWSSVREPSQVFILLETVFRAYDEIAKRRRVFKVETVGDCYVAVTGLPEPRKDHAVAMARFSMDCLARLDDLTKQLEVALGPDTAELSMRFGMHSGPVTAGVLRGERSRFQLFGDTMNTASRVETTGKPGKIHLSQETADLLIAAGKGHWVHKREDKVVAKGKGEMQTYWLDARTGLNSASDHAMIRAANDSARNNACRIAPTGKLSNAALNVAKVDLLLSEKSARLIDWNVDVLLKLLKQIMSRRMSDKNSRRAARKNVRLQREEGATVLDEVQEIIVLPDFKADSQRHFANVSPDSVAIAGEVSSQLFDYVLTIATLYRDNPFHNFDHASHVVMSVVKLMSRIVAPSAMSFQGRDVASSLHDHTYGITSDPLTQFACVFSALIHDVDHTGVPNSQLIKENSKIAALYKNKSVAEQNSVDLAWGLLMEDSYTHLRNCIFTTESEMNRFRQLVVNSVMATDIMDKDLKALRNARWDKAFQTVSGDSEEAKRNQNRKATIVIEHLIQASDVSHTMQHWHVYRKWNERLFKEMYTAFLNGRSDRNPAEFWYSGEIGFFDFYIIPLARKLKECGVFGVSSDEYLTYAIKNRKEWEARGKEIVSEMMQKVGAPLGLDD